MRALTSPSSKRLVATLALAAIAMLAGCGKVASKDPKAMTDAELTEELERCKGLGVKVYEDEACKAGQKERFDRFMGDSKGPKP